MQVQPISGLDDGINEIRLRTARIVTGDIIPAEPLLYKGGAEAEAVRTKIKTKVKDEGLWAPHLPEDYGGMGIGFLKHAYMNEIMAWSPFSARLFGVVAPNSGNQKILLKYGTPEQKKKWLEPLVAGDIESCFSMTEPDQPGSDPYAIQTRAVRDGDHWVINGHKWFTSNGRRADIAIVMCRTEEKDGKGGVKDKMTQIIVPMKTPGVNIIRSVPVWGHTGGDHCEIKYENVRVPVENQLGRTGTGHQAAQDRLGEGRVFHCMNSIGQMWRAFDLMCKRAVTREVHGGKLATKQFVQGFIADSYMDIQAARLMTIHCAHRMEEGAAARVDISAIKVFVPAAFERVVDRAIQVHGALGVSGDTPLAGMYQGARTLRLADGPDEVHRIVIAKSVLKCYHEGMSWDFGA
ncbi:acyl-CoA dehydrogenase family protein [Parvibaculum sp.]|uniref:acyl-CoA dehydrogenase family protein n=1 Tax=Parvibaculum sp. TaxID=2024848 RepID=UPI001D2A7C5B|nr:acyl-CoA dehydrogenase family protein [Parvibaculum sp.]MBX3490172.1 acyl-CoA dehydrogenase family protein [Parvibaculum sp.]MCW5725838.1 acyl-CoA dehydrogenase family protein [Parvibaculum sp.]